MSTLRIAMWSGPRNISTAMMRSWENRNDTSVVDEPFYACYLKHTQLRHPCFDEILASQSNDWNQVGEMLSTKSVSTPIFYQKHMTHHILSEVDLNWASQLQHIFLIRDPRRVIASYAKAMPSVTQQNIGILRQHQLYQKLCKVSTKSIPIIDAADVLENPKQILSQVCKIIGIEFDENMLRWPSGKRTSDGVWAKHWYHNVEKSTEFASPENVDFPNLSKSLKALSDEAMPYYLELYHQRIRAAV